MMKLLLWVMGLGVAALVAMVVLVAFAVSVHTSTSQAGGHAHPAFRPTAGDAAPPHPAHVAPPVFASCRDRGISCRVALLVMINQARARVGRGPLILDATQSYGIRGRCVGSTGHSIAMARTGRTWHSDAAHPRAGFPRDICVHTPIRAEVVASAAGSRWAALSRIARAATRPGKRAAKLLSPRYGRAGVGLKRRGGRLYVTIDLLG